ncbi:MAG: HTH domain-containing protein, partial [Proteobacteria bacterium]|nr:HTH domain-containing protein [Pseudomonadota bacterium]
MVNEKKNIKEEILKLLYLARGETISGVKLSDVLNISRVAVW